MSSLKTNPERLRYQRELYIKNKERYKNYSFKYRELHREEIRSKQRLRYRQNRERLLQQVRKYRKIKYKRDREKVLQYYSHGKMQCACCECKDIWTLCLDHIDNNGGMHRKNLGILSGQPFYRWIIKNNFPNGYQVLCRNCDWGKRLFGKCPHKA